MKIMITGGGGFIGTYLTRFLTAQGHRITALGTSPPLVPQACESIRFITADTSKKGAWQDELKKVDAVINLAGKTIFKRWTEKYKQDVYESRVKTTTNIVEALPDKSNLLLLNASAAGFYGHRGDDLLNEQEPGGNDFLAVVCRDWEKAAEQARSLGVRVVLARFGVVLGNNGGALAQMIPAYRFYVGGPLGSGTQWFPWIHIQDLLQAVDFLLHHDEIDGPVNFCGTYPARNRDLALALGRAMGRPSFMQVPAFLIRLLMGELGNAVLFSQRSIPQKLLHHGFTFTYPDIESALRATLTHHPATFSRSTD